MPLTTRTMTVRLTPEDVRALDTIADDLRIGGHRFVTRTDAIRVALEEAAKARAVTQPVA